MTDELRDQVARERQTETEIRKLDTSQVVEWIHGLEDGYADLELQVDRLRDTLAQSQAARAEAEECANRLRAELAEQWTASSTDYDRSIHHNPDAAAWADLFMQTYPNCGADRDTMLGWFANAIMSMYDSKIAPVEAERDRAMQACEQMGQQLAERDGQRPHMWAVEQQVEGQFIQGRPRKVWWECNDGIGQAFYAAPPSPRPAVPEGWRNVLEKAIARAEIFDDGSDGADGESARSVVTLLQDLLSASPTPPADGEAQCPMGDGCDLTVAYMAGFARGKDASGDGREAWRPIESLTVNDGAVLLYAETWVDPDFNPNGVRDGYRNETDGGPVWCARWYPDLEFWETDEDCDATHWRPQPEPPTAQAEKGGDGDG